MAFALLLVEWFAKPFTGPSVFIDHYLALCSLMRLQLPDDPSAGEQSVCSCSAGVLGAHVNALAFAVMFRSSAFLTFLIFQSFRPYCLYFLLHVSAASR